MFGALNLPWDSVVAEARLGDVGSIVQYESSRHDLPNIKSNRNEGWSDTV